MFRRSPARIILESVRAGPGSDHSWKVSGVALVESSLKVFGRNPGGIILERVLIEFSLGRIILGKCSGGALDESFLKVSGQSPGRIILESVRAVPGSDHLGKWSGIARVGSSLKVFGQSLDRIISESVPA